MAASDAVSELNSVLEAWGRESSTAGIDPVPKLKRLAEIVERETEEYYKMDPDPFDDRHPGRANPNCTLGHIFKTLFKNEDFMNKLVSEYLMSSREQLELQITACRLLLDVLPGLETSVIFQDTEGILTRLFRWAESAEDPLRSYATGLLAGAMELQDVASNFKENNATLVPVMLKRLHELQAQTERETEEKQQAKKGAANRDEQEEEDDDTRYFSMFSRPTQWLFASPKLNSVPEDKVGNKQEVENTDRQMLEQQQKSLIPTKEPMSKGDLISDVVQPKESISKESVSGCIVKGSTSSTTTVSDPEVTKSIVGPGKSVSFICSTSTIKTDSWAESSITADSNTTHSSICTLTSESVGSSAFVSESGTTVSDFQELESVSSHTLLEKGSSATSQAKSQKTNSDLSVVVESGDISETDQIGSPQKDEMNKDDMPQTVQDIAQGATGSSTSPDKSSGSVVIKEKIVENGILGSDVKVVFENKEMSPCTSKLEGSTTTPKIVKRRLSPGFSNEDLFSLKKQKKHGHSDSFLSSDYSNSSWNKLQPYVIGSYSLDPLTTTMKQRLILQYLCPMGEYQELISAAFEHKALDLLFFYINLKKNNDVRLAFEALKYLAILLCHKKFAIEFLNLGGVQKLLDVYRPSISATGVSMCLYYLSYFEDAMERVCLLPDHVLSVLVNYVLWLLECSHDSSRCHAAMFFANAFPFKVILDLFDKNDGLRRLFNVISTLPILSVENGNHLELTEDQIFTMRQLARHTCSALKKYFEVHLVIKADEIRRSHLRNEGGSPIHETPAYKPMQLTPEIIQENIELMMEVLPLRLHWQPEATFHKLGGIPLLVQLIAMTAEWNNYTGRPETIKNALDVLNVCCATSKSQLTLLQSIPLPDDVTTPIISVPIGVAEGDIIADPEVQKSALNIIINCVCGPLERFGGGVGRYMGQGSKKKVNLKVGEDVLSKIWNGVRTNNGIMVLLKLLTAKTPITDADAIRALACKALVGLARSDTVRQIISKLPLFTNGQIQILMKEPVLQDKRQEHVKFCKYASELMEKVSGKQGYNDASLEEIRRADIVAQTKIFYQEKELLQLIYNHLLSKGCAQAASVLQQEAHLPRSSTPPPILPAGGHALFNSPIVTPKISRSQIVSPGHTCISASSFNQASTSVSSHHSNKDSTPTPGTPGPIKFSFNKHGLAHPSPSVNNTKALVPKSRYIKERDQHGLNSPALRGKGTVMKVSTEMTLDKIVTEYLRKQHALCRNPVATCPVMSLFKPHQCPEPRGRSHAPISLPSRLQRRMIFPKFGGMDGAQANRKFVFSRFKPLRTFKDGDDDGFSCCSFSACESYLLLGTFIGDIKLIDLQTGEEQGNYTCHNSPISRIEPSKNGSLLLTSTMWGTLHGSSLWSWENMENKYNFEDFYVEFSKLVQDRIVGTKDETAHIYDVATGQQLLKLYDADKANSYKANRACFNPTDELVLNDGVLWDIRSGKSIHKFDKFNSYISGVFHPTGLEIIINSEVWDVRSFRLLHTVPALDQSQLRFSDLGDVIYATHIDEENDIDEERFRSPYGSTFRTFDGTNYSSIATIDVKSRNISDLCTDRSDCYLAIVENQHFIETGAEENICRIYELGKLKDKDDDQADEEEEEEMEEEDDDDDDEDDDIIQIDDGEIENLAEDMENEINAEGENGDEEEEEEEEEDDDDDDIEAISLSDEDDDSEPGSESDEDILFELV
ncbi:hypothetical protein ACJMK2_015948 [Sinanodonta woodiana]|uniref:DDB1- and CUL4-associated factor 1 n=1 Tax=Sinanodonta woodiana TaxID=1069815 RepID=A0ABD3UU47_SINWO